MKSLKIIITAVLTAVLLCGCSSESNTSEVSKNTLDGFESMIVSVDSGVGTFYYPDNAFNDYFTVERDFDGTPQNVVDILYELGNYGNNVVKVNSWYISGDTMYIDFDRGFANATGSTAQEYFSVLGTVKTLKSCFGVSYVRLTVNGDDFNTPHGAYNTAM